MDTNNPETLDEDQAEAVWNEEASRLEAGDDLPAEVTPESDMLDDDQPEAVQQHDTSAEGDVAPTPEPDPYEGLAPPLAEKLKKLERENAELTHKVSSSEGRLAAIQREFQQARQAAAHVAPQDAPSQKQIANAVKTPEKWEKLKEDFPEFADAMEEYVSANLGNSAPGVDPRVVAQFVRDQQAAQETRFARTVEQLRIEGRHPNWEAEVNTPEFAEWAIAQPPEVTALAHSTRSADAIKMLDLYHEAKSRSATDIRKDRSSRLQAAATTRPGQTPPPKTVDSMSAEELWNHEARQRDKRRQQQGF